MINTNCQECIFSDPITSSKPCQFDIIDSIKDIKTLKNKNDYYVIENYQCRYCFSKKIKEKNKEILKDIDIVNEIKTRNLIQYSLVIDSRIENNYEQIVGQINKFTIKPRYLLFLSCKTNSSNIESIEKNINKKIKWKIQNFFEDSIDYNSAIRIALDTNKDIKKHQFLWILKPDQLSYCNENKAIEKINYIVNVEQPVCNFIRSKKYVNNNFHNLFMNYATYNHIVKNINSSLEEGIDSLENKTIVYYD
jgi:hypothetical protein